MNQIWEGEVLGDFEDDLQRLSKRISHVQGRLDLE